MISTLLSSCRRLVLPAALFVATACREQPTGAPPDPASASPSDIPLSGMCAPTSTQSCAEWCAEHGRPEAECVVCQHRGDR